ncbi:small G protein signaling modulator 2 isoform X7 [Loxodonta africana]|uniref:small G protein signaling modulator 2 isoform X7 n=1 Tax=Loxodonta africana TaxID=9785 RepID=UPI0030CE9B77
MGSEEDTVKEKLLWNVKKEVKQIMEEAVTRKFVHEDSSHIIALCGSGAVFLCGPGAVEACLLHQLRRRAAGFLRSDKMAALFTKVGKTCPVAGEICHKVQELQQQVEGRKPLGGSHEALRRQCSASGKALTLSPQALKHIWVRTALVEKVLDRVVQYLVENCSKYYEKEALLADPVFGPILASLLVGPCALEYTKLKTADHYWTDPSADELVQRHRIRGPPNRQDSPAKRPALGIRKRHSSGGASEDRLAACAREYVESLHQNSRTRLLYGKNNVLVQPKEDMEAVPGYLSLHQSAENLTLKWTPNQLMNGTLGDSELEKSVYWDYALVVPFSQIVCIHCHQQKSGGTLVLVSQDGIQRPPLHFPQGGHLLSFLSCLENGLLPRGQLEPPLWTQQGKGKVFPKLRKRSSIRSVDVEEMGMGRATDYVFRIVYPGHRHEHITINYHHLAASRAASVDDEEEEEDKLHSMLSMICSRNLTAPNPMKDAGDMIEMQGFGPSLPAWHLKPLCSQGSPCLSCSSSSSPFATPSHCSCIPDRLPLRLLCESMKRQIVSRAFYGWLAYCRHLSTVRTHLSALVHHNIIPPDRPPGAPGGLTKDVWSKYQKDKKNYKELELLRQVYYGGVEHEIRKDVWPFLLGHYKFGMSKKEMEQAAALTATCSASSTGTLPSATTCLSLWMTWSPWGPRALKILGPSLSRSRKREPQALPWWSSSRWSSTPRTQGCRPLATTPWPQASSPALMRGRVWASRRRTAVEGKKAPTGQNLWPMLSLSPRIPARRRPHRPGSWWRQGRNLRPCVLLPTLYVGVSRRCPQLAPRPPWHPKAWGQGLRGGGRDVLTVLEVDTEPLFRHRRGTLLSQPPRFPALVAFLHLGISHCPQPWRGWPAPPLRVFYSSR